MTPKVPTSDSGTATLGMAVARALRRKTNTTAVTSSTLRIERHLHVAHRGADGRRCGPSASVMSIAGEIDCFS